MQLCQYFPHAEFQIPEKELRSRADLRWVYIAIYYIVMYLLLPLLSSSSSPYLKY
jgi:hypothetical protein